MADPNLTGSFQVTPDQINTFRAELAANGISVPDGNSGVFTTKGVTIDFVYDGISSLILTISGKPWYDPVSAIWDEIEKYLPIQA